MKKKLLFLLFFILITLSLNAQFTEDFNSVTIPNLPANWSSVVDATTSQAKVETDNVTFPPNGQQHVQLKNGPDENANLILITPQVTNLTTQTFQIRFMAKRNFRVSTLLVGTVPDTSFSTTFTNFQTIALTETNTEYTVVFDSSYNLSDTYIAFKHGAGAENLFMYIDDVIYEESPIILPSCSSNEIATQNPSCGNYPLDFNWDSTLDATGYKISIGTSTGATDIENLTDLGTSLNYTLSTPTENTTYFWTITPYNSFGDASGCLENTFITSPNTCYFEPHPISVDGNGITNVTIGSINNTTAPLNSDPYYEDYSNLSTDVTTGTLENIDITFDTGVSYSAFVFVDWNNDFDFEDADEIYFLGNSDGAINSWDFSIPPTATEGNKRMRIGGVLSSYGFDELQPLNPFYSAENDPLGDHAEFEDYTLNVIVSNCIEPFELGLVNLTSNSVNLQWLDFNNGNTSYLVEWREVNTVNWSSFTTNNGDISYIVNSLLEETTYEWKVSATCGSNAINGPVFTTLCLPESAPYTYGFESDGNLNNCWRQEDFNDDFDWEIHSGTTQTSLTGPDGANTGTYYLYTDSTDKNPSDSATIFTPDIDISTITSPSLNFYYHMYGFNMGTDASFDVAISTDNRVSYTSILNTIGNQGNQWNEVTVDLSSYSGIINFRITATIGSNGSIFQHDFAIDDFVIESSNACSGIDYTWDGTAWSPIGIPTINDTVTINGFYDTAVFGNIDTCSLQVNVGGLLDVKENNYINVNNEIINDGVINVFATGSVVQINNNATVTGTGTYTTQIETTKLLDADRFTYFSSPTPNENLTIFSSWANMDAIYDFDGTTQLWHLTDGIQNMEIAKGYAVRGDDFTLQSYPFIVSTEFIGPFNNGIINQTVYHNVGTSIPGFEDDNNLVGNPYPSAIDADMLLIQNPNIDAFYIWTHATAANEDNELVIADYAAWTLGGGTLNLSGKIASGQGFFAGTNDNNPNFPLTGNIEFNNAMRVTTGNDDFRNTSRYQKIWLNLKDESNGVFKQILVSFMPQGTNNYDVQYDAKSNHGINQFAFYSIDDATNSLIINTVGELTNAEKVIPLGISLEENTNTNFKLSIDHHQNLEDVSIYLLDKVLNIKYDLKISDFNFNPNNETLINDRYEILFIRNSLSINESLSLEDDLVITNYNETQIRVQMKGGTIITKLLAYNTLGKSIVDLTYNSNNFIIDKHLKQGQVLFIKVYLENGQVLFKKFVKL